MLDGAPIIQSHPTPMGRFGKNPFQENLYRIVLAPSVARLIGGEWPDGSRGYRWSVPLSYRSKGWILESWDWCRVSPREWESSVDPFSGWPVNGPYPTRGEYYLSWEFDRGVESDSLEKIIGAIERGRRRSFEEVRQFHKTEYEYEERNRLREQDAENRDGFTAFGVTPKPISSRLVSRGTKTMPELKSANELGLPIPRAVPLVDARKGNRRTLDLRDTKIRSAFIAGR